VAQSRVCGKKGAVETLQAEPPTESVVLNIDEMGPDAAKSYPSEEAVNVQMRPVQRAKGYVFGALWEATGDYWTQCYPRRTKEHFLDCLWTVCAESMARVP
jgi:hypothetical protein